MLTEFLDVSYTEGYVFTVRSCKKFVVRGRVLFMASYGALLCFCGETTGGRVIGESGVF